MPFKTFSVHGAEGQGTNISFTRHLDFNTAKNEKRIMQNLNDRLESYIQNVHALQTKNAELERKIKERLSHSVVSKDHTDFFSTINHLQNQIVNTVKDIEKTGLMIDNAKFAIEDFRQMYENEATFRLRAEAGVNNVRNNLDAISLHGKNLEMEYESLKEDRIILEKNHKEELALKRDQTGVQVSVDSATTTDMGSALQDIREIYESVVAKNRKDLEFWYKNKTLLNEQEVSGQSEEPEFSRQELKVLNSTYQMMQIELQAIRNMSTFCEANISDIEAQYSEQLAKLEITITDLEFKLQQINTKITKKKKEYDSLESEIKEYRLLLNGKDSEHQIIYKTLEETVVNKVVVESSKTETIN